MNLEGGKLFFPNEGKGPHEGPGYCYQHCFSLKVVVVLMMIHPFHTLAGVIVDTKKDEDKYNLIFLLGPGIYD